MAKNTASSQRPPSGASTSTSGPAPGPSRKLLLLQLVLLAAAVLLAYSNHFNNAFQFDDTHTIQSNMAIRSLSNLPRFFTDTHTSSYRPENSGYRPLTTTAIALGFAISNIDTWGYHLIKFIEHLAVTLFVFFLALRVLPRGGHAARYRNHIAFFAALIFGVHRVHTEVVNYICAVSTLQAGFFFIAAFMLYLRWRESRRAYLYALSALFYMCSMWSKEEGITLPLVIVLYEWIYTRAPENTYIQTLKENWKSWLLTAIPYGILAIIFCALRWGLMDAVAHTSTGNTPRDIYFMTQLHSWLHYWYQFFYPYPLNADNLSFPWISDISDPLLWGCITLHAIILFTAWKIGKRHRSILFLTLWTYVTVLPASSFFPLVEAVNEHRAYIPYMGFSILVVWALAELLARAKLKLPAIASVFIVLAGLLTWGTLERNKVWASDLALWEDIYAQNPESPRAMNVLGVALLQREEYTRSRFLLERCHAINPQFLPCYVHLSMVYAHDKEFDKGLDLLLQSQKIDPNYPHTTYHLGLYYKDYFGNLDAAKPYFKRVMDYTQNRFYHAALKLAEIELIQGRVQSGMKMANDIVVIDRLNGDAWDIVARGYVLQGNYDEGLMIYTKLYESSPTVFRYLISMANIFERKGDFAQARRYYEESVKKDPHFIQGWSGIARSAGALKDAYGKAEALKKVEELKNSKTWTWMPALFLVGEEANQIAPK